MPWKWIVCAHWTYTAAHLTGHKSWLWMVHSVTVTQQRASVLGHMCTEALTFISAQALGGQILPRRNKCRGRPISDTCVVSRTYRNTSCWRWPHGKRRNGQGSEAVGQVSTTSRFAAYRCVDAVRGSAYSRATSWLTSLRSFRRGVTHTQSGGGRGSGHVFEIIGAMWLC